MQFPSGKKEKEKGNFPKTLFLCTATHTHTHGASCVAGFIRNLWKYFKPEYAMETTQVVHRNTLRSRTADCLGDKTITLQ